MPTTVETVKTFINVLKKYSNNSSEIGNIALNDAVRTVTTYSSLDDAKKDIVNKFKDTETYPDTDTRLQKATGIVLGAEGDYTADTGAIIGYNAGGSTVRNANTIVPEDDVDLSTLPLPEPGSTSQITYTGNDGKTFTFNVKWPDSFTTMVHGFNLSSLDEMDYGLLDSRNYVDLSTANPNDQCSYVETNADGSTETVTYPSYGAIMQGMTTILKGLNNYWFRECAKLNYDSLGLGQGTGNSYAYPAGDMFIRFIAQQSSNVTPMIGDSTQQQTFSYSTGNGVVSGYKEGDVINYNLTDGGNLNISGQLGTFVLEKNEKYYFGAADYQNKTWSQKF